MTTPATTPADMTNLYRKKPVAIEAVKYEGSGNFANPLLPAWMWDALENGVVSNRKGDLIIKTLEGEHLASPGDWIIRGVKGELYPCKPDIFTATYEPALATPSPGKAPEPVAPSGTVVVPIHPTKEMREAGAKIGNQGWDFAHHTWRTMLLHAPVYASPGKAEAERCDVIVDCYAIPTSEHMGAEVKIQRARQLEGPDLWKVTKHGDCLNKAGEWEYEPLPSSRDDAFIARCRFASAADAIGAAIQQDKKEVE